MALPSEGIMPHVIAFHSCRPLASANFQNSPIAVTHSSTEEVCTIQVGRLSALAGSACSSRARAGSAADSSTAAAPAAPSSRAVGTGRRGWDEETVRPVVLATGEARGAGGQVCDAACVRCRTWGLSGWHGLVEHAAACILLCV